MALRVAIAGLGSRGCDWIREVRSAPAFSLVACVDTDPAAFEKVGARFGVAPDQCFHSLDEALARMPFDIAIVATAAEHHVGPCSSAISKGVPVLVEKPFTLSLREAIDLVSLAEAKKVPLLVAQNYRYMRSFRTTKRLIDEGALGPIGMIACHYYRPPHQMAPSLRTLANSVLFGVAVHHFDALRYVVGKDVTGVTADSFTLPWGELPPGASLQVLLSMGDSTRASYTATYESSGHEFFERGQEFYARFVGQTGTLHVFHRWLLLCEKGKLPRVVRRGRREVTEEQILLRQLERAVVKGDTPEVSGRDNLQTVAVLEACVRSASEHRTINPQELLREHY